MDKEMFRRAMFRSRNQVKAFLFVLTTFSAASVVYYVVQSFDLGASRSNLLSTIANFFPLVVLMAVVGAFLYFYLEGARPSKEVTFQNVDEVKLQFKRYFEDLRQHQDQIFAENRNTLEQIQAHAELQLSDTQRLEIFQALKTTFAQNINEAFFRDLNLNIATELTREKQTRRDLLFREFDSIKVRLTEQIEKLNRKANLNLVIGSLTTGIALFSLGLFVYQGDLAKASTSELLYHYIPRISLIIFIEVFAYFFLRLYKLNLNDMKYFQNELTTVELKLTSITTAINFGTEADISNITTELSKSERNLVLKKGETTAELEKARIEKTEIKELAKTIASFANLNTK